MGPDKRETQPGYYLTGQVAAAYIQVRLTPQDFGRPRKRDSQGSTCICLPARSPALRDGGRGIFDQPEKMSFSTGSLGLTLPTASGSAFKGGIRRCRSGSILIKFRSSGQQVEGLTLGGASLIKFKSE